MSSSFERRDDDDFDVRVVLLDDLEDLEAADAGQADVEHHQVDVLLLHHLQRGFARARPAARESRVEERQSAYRASLRRRRR